MKKYITLLLQLFFVSVLNLYSQDKTIDSLITMLNNTGYDTNRVAILNTISKKYLYTYPEKAIQYNKSSLKLSKEIHYKEGEAAAYDIGGIYYQNKGEFDKAKEYYQHSLKLRIQINNPNLIATSYNNFGVLNRRKGDFSESKDFFLKSLEICLQQKDSAQLSRIYNNLGLVMENLGKYEESVSYHLKSMDIREKTGDRIGVASSLNNIGIVFISIRKYDEALEYLNKSLEIKKKIGNQRSIASTFVNIGNVNYYKGDYDEALNNFDSSLKIYQFLGEKRNMGAVLSNMAYIAKKKGDFNSAISYNLQSIRLIEDIGSKDKLCDSYTSVASTYLELKDYKQAHMYARKAKEISIRNDMLPELNNILHLLYRIESAQGNYKRANNYLENYMQIKDSLFNEANNKQILELQEKYETEKKEKEIAVLSEKNTLQELKLEKRNSVIIVLLGIVVLIILTTIFALQQYKIKQKQKAIELEQKLLRLQMNPHFIFNAISAIQHYILKNKPLEAGSYLSSFAKLMRSILNNSTMELVSLESEIQTLENYLKLQQLRLNGNLEYHIEGNFDTESNELAIPPMLLQPFIENAIEHGILKKESQKGEIDICFSEKKDKLFVEIKDNGIGREKAGKIKNKNHQSLAMEITNSRIKTMKQSYKKNISFNILDLKDDKNTPIGTKIIFELPLMYI